MRKSNDEIWQESGMSFDFSVGDLIADYFLAFTTTWMQEVE